ncbi:MAG: hypothetical protein Q7T74_03200, partial [Candidatus Saccharibacteria bacterium]|nr:hypothetical protein [Candidatus Saccharibacteria bacterium]
PNNSTVDFAIGGNATTSAQFAITGIANGAPTATISATTNNNGLSFTAATSTLQSLRNNSLTIGGNTTGNIVLSPLNGAAGSLLTANTQTFTLSGTATLNGTSLTAINGGATAINFTEFDVAAGTGSITIDDDGNLGNITVDGTALDINSLDFVAAGTITSGGANTLTLDSGNATITLAADDTTLAASGLTTITAGNLATITSAVTLGVSATTLNLGAGSAATIGTISDDNLTLTPNGTGNLLLSSDFDSSVFVGNATTPAPLSISGGIGGNATLVVNQTNSGDILSASSSGTTRFRVQNTGELTFADNNSSFFGTLDLTTLTANRTFNFPNATGTVCLEGSLSCGFALGTNYFQLNSNLLSPINSTFDFAVGGSSTVSAAFAVTNVAAGTPVATLSASTNSNGLSLDAANARIQSQRYNTLNIGGDTTGNIVISSKGSDALSIQGTAVTNAGTFTSNGLISANAGVTLAGGQNLTLTGFAQGSVLYTNGSAIVTSGVTGTANQVLHGGTVPSFSAVDLAADVSGILPIANGGSPFEQGSGAIYERIITQDFLLGGISTGSAKFAVLNIAGGTPTASISANSGNGAAYLTGAGILGTTNAQTLTLGSSTTGNINISPFGTSRVGIGFNTSPLGMIDIRSSLGTLPIAALSGTTSYAGLSVNNSGTGDIITASSSGTPVFAVTNNGGLQFAGGSGILHTLTNSSNDSKSYDFPDFVGTTAEVCLDTGNCAGAGSGITGSGVATRIAFFDGAQNITSDSDLYFDQTNTRLGLGTSSPFAALDIRNYSGTLPIATFSGTTSFAGLVVDNGGVGDLITASTSGATRFNVTNLGNVQFSGGTTYLGTLTTTIAANKTFTLPNFVGSAADICLSTGNCAGAGSSITGSGVATRIAFFDAVQNITSDSNLYFDATNKRLGLGVSSPLATLDVRTTSGTSPIATISGSTSFAGLVVDNSGVGDLFTASKSGATKFVVYNNGTLGIAGANNALSLLNSDATSSQVFTLPNASGTLCLSSNNCGFATTGENYWQLNSGLVSTNNSTYDFALGGISTASAQFAVVGIAAGTPVATISATSNNNGLSIDAATSSIQSLRKNTLTIGGSTTGNIVLDSGSGVVQLADSSIQFTGTSPVISSTSTLTINAFTLGGSIAGGGNNITNLTNLDLGTNNLSFNGNTITNGANNSITITPSGTGDLLISADDNTGVSIGSVTTPAPLSISSHIGGNAALIVNQTGGGDLITASASGTTRFRVTNTGEIVLSDNNSSFFGTLDLATLTADRSYSLPNENGTICIL